jgi:integrase/recombinase XerD
MAVARLFDDQGRRLFFTEEERRAFIAAANEAPDKVRSFCSLLHYTGCNSTDGINVTPQNVDCAGSLIHFQNHKSRLHYGARDVSVPASFIELLDEVHDIRRAQSGPRANERIWPQDRKTMDQKVMRVIAAARILPGPHATAKGIRFGFLVHAIRNGIPLTRIATWMGYSHVLYVEQFARDLSLYAPGLPAHKRVRTGRADAELMW